MGLVSSVVSGAIAGLIASFGGKMLIDRYKKPKLEFDSGIIRKGQSTFEESYENSEYMLEVRNSGRSVAESCKPKIILEGTEESTEKREEIGPYEETQIYEIEVERRYTIDITREWNESDSPARISLNRDEHSRFDLFSVTSDHFGPNVEIDVNFGQHRENPEDVDNLYSEPVRVEYYGPEAGFEPLVTTQRGIPKEDFEEIEWETQMIRITSANADKIEADFDISWGDSPHPEVKLI